MVGKEKGEVQWMRKVGGGRGVLIKSNNYEMIDWIKTNNSNELYEVHPILVYGSRAIHRMLLGKVKFVFLCFVLFLVALRDLTTCSVLLPHLTR